MREVFEPRDYSVSGFRASFWAQNARHFDLPTPTKNRFDLIIIGSGYTGLHASLSAIKSRSVLVMDTNAIASGCSSRNGGDLCIGGSFLDGTTIERRYQGLDAWNRFTQEAMDFTKSYLLSNHLQVHGQNEFAYLTGEKERRINQGSPSFESQVDGLPYAPFGMISHEGYSINPRDYSEFLVENAFSSGVEFAPNCCAQKLVKDQNGWQIKTRSGDFFASKVLIATNGYMSQALHPQLRRAIYPIRSHIIVTEAIDPKIFDAIGWSRLDPLYDTNFFLHYFRKLPDNRVLLGMRGAFDFQSSENFKDKIKADFDIMFPALSHTKIAHSWSGLVAMTRRQIPFIGAIEPNLFAAFGYHGNGIALGSYAGHQIGRILSGEVGDVPKFLASPPQAFPPAWIMRSVLGALSWRTPDPLTLQE